MFLKKTIVLTGIILPSISISANLTLYSNTSFYGNEEIKDFNKNATYISVPDTILPDTFIANSTNTPIKILKTEYQKNNVYKLLKENIGTNVKFNENEYKLNDIYQDFLILENTENNKIIYAKFSKIDSIELENNIPLKEGIFKITADTSTIEDVNISYSYAFNGMKWFSNHKIFIDPEYNIDHKYNLTIDNNTDIKYDNVNLSLLSGDISINNNNYRPRQVGMEMASKRMDISQQNFESFSGFQKLTFPNRVNIDSSTKTELTYKEFKNFPNEFEYHFNSLYKQNQVVKNIHPNMSIVLKRKDNKDYQFPFTSGKVSVYKLDQTQPDNYSKATIIHSGNIKDYSKDEDVKIHIGNSYDVYMNYSSEKIKSGEVILDKYKNRYSHNTYVFNIEVTNNEPKKVKLLFPFNGSENIKEPIIKYIDPETTENYQVEVTYKENL